MERLMKHAAWISGALTLLFVLLRAWLHRGILLTAAITAGTVFYHIAVRLLAGALFDRFPDSRIDCGRRWYRVSAQEQALYEKLHVKRWKGRLPTYDAALFDPACRSWADIARAMCRSEKIHEVDIALSFVPLAASRWFGAFPAFLVTSVLAALCDLTFVIVQRCNRPRVLRLAAREEAKKKAPAKPEP